jgi:uncharacterized protein related to proFAR isomerase
MNGEEVMELGYATMEEIKNAFAELIHDLDLVVLNGTEKRMSALNRVDSAKYKLLDFCARRSTMREDALKLSATPARDTCLSRNSGLGSDRKGS